MGLLPSRCSMSQCSIQPSLLTRCFRISQLMVMVLTGARASLFPGTILFFVLGIWHLAFREAETELCRGFGYGTPPGHVVHGDVGASRRALGWHHYRYLLPFFPPLLVLAVVGFYSLHTPGKELAA